MFSLKRGKIKRIKKREKEREILVCKKIIIKIMIEKLFYVYELRERDRKIEIFNNMLLRNNKLDDRYIILIRGTILYI